MRILALNIHSAHLGFVVDLVHVSAIVTLRILAKLTDETLFQKHGAREAMLTVQVEMLSCSVLSPACRGLWMERDAQIYTTQCRVQHTVTQVCRVLETFKWRESRASDVPRSPHSNSCCFHSSPAHLWLCCGQCRCQPIMLPWPVYGPQKNRAWC